MKKIFTLTGGLLLIANSALALNVVETSQMADAEQWGDWQIGVSFDVSLELDEIGTFNYLAIGNNDAEPSSRDGLNSDFNQYGADLAWDAPEGWEVVAMERDSSNNWRATSMGFSFGQESPEYYNDDFLFENDWRGSNEDAVTPDFTWINTNTGFEDFDRLFLFYNKAHTITWETTETVIPGECFEEGEVYCLEDTVITEETGNFTLSEYTMDTVDYYRFSGYTQQMWSPFAALQSDGTVLTGEATHAGDPVPEPTTMLLFGAGLAGIVGARVRRKR